MSFVLQTIRAQLYQDWNLMTTWAEAERIVIDIFEWIYRSQKLNWYIVFNGMVLKAKIAINTLSPKAYNDPILIHRRSLDNVKKIVLILHEEMSIIC
jgi:hypothetical protein